MANKKISTLDDIELVGGTSTAGIVGADVIPVTDVSDTTGSAQGTTKKVTVTDLINLAPQGDLESTNNLSDLNNTATARTNLGLGTASTADTGTGDGDVLAIGSGALDVGGNAISNFDASINDQTGTTYTLVAGDNGKVVVLDNASAVAVTVPSGLGAGFNCSFVQKGAGQVSFSASGTTINNRQGHAKINGQYGVASIVAYASDFFVLAGDTTA